MVSAGQQHRPSPALAVLVIHGIGQQKAQFATSFIRDLKSQVQKTGKDPDRIVWRPIWWADVLEPAQQAYFDRAMKAHPLRYRRTRRAVISVLGNAVAYRQRLPLAEYADREGRAYQLIHQRFQENIAELYQSQLGGRPVPLVVLAHSFGSHIFSNFTWDHQHHPDPTLSSFERMNWLTVIVTSGSNIPLFTFACREVIPIRFPPPRLPRRLKQKARWLNYFDYDDVLGWPLKPINKAYAQTVSEDRAIRVGGALTGWNPASHGRYWSERKFVGEVARLLTTFL